MIQTQNASIRIIGSGITSFYWDFDTKPTYGSAQINLFIKDLKTRKVHTIDRNNFSVDMANKKITYPLSGAPVGDDKMIIIARWLDIVQLTQYYNQGLTSATTLEEALDYRTMIEQQIKDGVNYLFIGMDIYDIVDDDVVIKQTLEQEIADRIAEVARLDIRIDNLDDKLDEEVARLDGRVDDVDADLQLHKSNVDNPHSTTAHQTGTYTSAEIDLKIQEARESTYHIVGYQTTVEPDDLAKESVPMGVIWINSAAEGAPSLEFPIACKKWDKEFSEWRDFDYTAETWEVISNKNDTKGYYYFGDEWNLIDQNIDLSPYRTSADQDKIDGALEKAISDEETRAKAAEKALAEGQADNNPTFTPQFVDTPKTATTPRTVDLAIPHYYWSSMDAFNASHNPKPKGIHHIAGINDADPDTFAIKNFSNVDFAGFTAYSTVSGLVIVEVTVSGEVVKRKFNLNLLAAKTLNNVTVTLTAITEDTTKFAAGAFGTAVAFFQALASKINGIFTGLGKKVESVDTTKITAIAYAANETAAETYSKANLTTLVIYPEDI